MAATTTGKPRVVITGASSGVGRACALRFAELGYHTFAGVRNESDGAALAAAAKGTIEPLLLDVTSVESIAAAAARLGDAPLAGLVNNAGSAVVGPLELLPLDALRRQFEVNVIGLVAVTQTVLANLRAGQGRIVNIGSIAGRTALPGSGAYDSSKFAVSAISDVLRMELRSSGIRVALIEPGAVATAVWEKSLRGLDDLRGLTPPQQYAPYATLMSTLRRETERAARHAMPVDRVVRAVVHAMTARRPRTRYVLGADAWMWLALSWLPDRWRDRLILSVVKD
jgi:NAD(P)-dependent dehydrogenase (short-subunit alcohol dehydrogenase family)